MNHDLSAHGRGIKGIEQQVRNDLNNFTSEAHDSTLRLKALMNGNPSLISLGAVKVQYFTKNCIQCEFSHLVGVAMKFEHMGSDAA